MKKILIGLFALIGCSTSYAYHYGKFGFTPYSIILAPSIQSHQFDITMNNGVNNNTGPQMCIFSSGQIDGTTQGNLTLMGECYMVVDPHQNITNAFMLDVNDLTTQEMDTCGPFPYIYTEATKNIPQTPHAIMISEKTDGTIVCAMIQ